MQSKLITKQNNDSFRNVPEERQYITKERLKELLPRRTSIIITDEIMRIINSMEDDTGLPQNLLEEDVMSYMSLIGTVKGVGVKDLINAVKFCNLKRNLSNIDAWSIVFPSKYRELKEAGKQIDNHVSMYNRSKLVIAIDKEMIMPVSLQYAGHFHAAVQKQFELMNGKTNVKDSNGKLLKVTPMVQHLAAKELANLTRPPEETKIDLKISPSDAAVSTLQEMNDQIKKIVAHQKNELEKGADIIDVQAIGVDFNEIGSTNE